MNSFDPKDARRILLCKEDLQRNLAYNFNEIQLSNALGSLASAFCRNAIECIFLGHLDDAIKLLDKADNWLQVAINQRETPARFLPLATEAERFLLLALIHWLLFDKIDRTNLNEFVKLHQQFWPQCKFRNDKFEVGAALAKYVDADAYTEALKIYSGNSRLSPPKSVKGTTDEANMAYVISRDCLFHEYSAADVQGMATHFLRANLGEWLRKGQFERAARWIKILNWREASGISSTTAIQNSLKFL